MKFAQDNGLIIEKEESNKYDNEYSKIIFTDGTFCEFIKKREYNGDTDNTYSDEFKIIYENFQHDPEICECGHDEIWHKYYNKGQCKGFTPEKTYHMREDK